MDTCRCSTGNAGCSNSFVISELSGSLDLRNSKPHPFRPGSAPLATLTAQPLPLHQQKNPVACRRGVVVRVGACCRPSPEAPTNSCAIAAFRWPLGDGSMSRCLCCSRRRGSREREREMAEMAISSGDVDPYDRLRHSATQTRT